MTNEQGGLYFRVISLARTATKVGLMNLVYNMRRLVQIDKLKRLAFEEKGGMEAKTVKIDQISPFSSVV